MPTETKLALSEEQTSMPDEQTHLPGDQTFLPAKRGLVKLFFLILLSVHPIWFSVMLSLQIIKTVYDIRLNRDGDAAPEEAASYEQAARDAIRPVLTEKYGLKEFDVKYTRPGWYAGERRICDAGEKTECALRLKIIVPDEKHIFEIAEEIARIKRETSGLPQCPFVLEFAYLPTIETEEPEEGKSRRFKPFHNIAAIVIPDAANGYNGRWKWDIGDFSPWDGFFSINWEARQ